jgi:hypothetical protein
MMTTENPIKPLLEALASVLYEAVIAAAEAADAIAKGNQNQAIGTLLDLEHRLPTAQALYNAALALHRLPRKGGAQ